MTQGPQFLKPSLKQHMYLYNNTEKERVVCSAKGLFIYTDALQSTPLANLVTYFAGETEQKGDIGQGQTRGVGSRCVTF